jgi:hypothetical protein
MHESDEVSSLLDAHAFLVDLHLGAQRKLDNQDKVDKV